MICILFSKKLDEDEIEEKFGKNSLKPEMTDHLYKLVAKCFKFITKQKIYSVGRFVTARKDANGEPFKALRVACGANNGYLYPLKKSFMYIHKPAVHIPYSR